MKTILAFAAILTLSHAQISCDVNSVMVSGNADVKVEPNIATLEMTVQATALRTSEALNEMNQMVTRAFQVFRAQGIPEDDYSTSNLRFSPQYDYSNGQSVLIGQQASQSLSVTIRNIDTDNENGVAELITALAESVKGIEIENVSFDQSDKTLGVKQARREAYNSALKKAEQLARLSNREVSRVKRI